MTLGEVLFRHYTSAELASARADALIAGDITDYDHLSRLARLRSAQVRAVREREWR